MRHDNAVGAAGTTRWQSLDQGKWTGFAGACCVGWSQAFSVAGSMLVGFGIL